MIFAQYKNASKAAKQKAEARWTCSEFQNICLDPSEWHIYLTPLAGDEIRIEMQTGDEFVLWATALYPCVVPYHGGYRPGTSA